MDDSSQTNKFHKIYNSKIDKYGMRDTIVFGKVLGYEKAFLIQNMCPISSKYINNEYVDLATNISVRISGVLENELIKKTHRVLALQRQGKKLVFPDILKIEAEIINNLP